jgi:N4-gp56 family major capsid protein
MPNTGKSVMPVTLIDTPPDTPSKDDPLRQRGTLGWKTTFVAKILNQNFLVKIEHGATA